jgi:hypothetical protein
VVDHDFRAGRRRTGAADNQLPWAMAVDRAIGALERRRDQGAAAQALGVAERRDVDVMTCPGCAKAGSIVVTITAATFFGCICTPAAP